MAMFFQQLLSVGYVPQEWKCAIITPVFKKGPTSCVANYRPISLTCIASKIMERIIAKSILQHLIINSLLSSAQHGFVQRRSTCTNLLECINDWTVILQDGNSVTVVCIDFNKAFDSVAHDKLFARFSQYGIKSNLLEWLKNFFKNRTHSAKVGYTLSSTAELMSGVVQGSGIAPIAFLIYFLTTLQRS